MNGDTLDLTETEHRVASAIVTDDTFELSCSCGWAISSRSGMDVLDRWAWHRSGFAVSYG